MASHNNVSDTPSTLFHPKADGNGAPPHLEDDVLVQRDGMTASPSPEPAAHMVEDRVQKVLGKLPEDPQTVSIPTSTDPSMALLIEALNQTNALILQQNARIGALEAV